MFALVPAFVLDRLTPAELRCYVALAMYARKETRTCWPRATTLAERLGRDYDGVRRTLRALAKKGAIVVEGGGVYRLPMQPEATVERLERPKPETIAMQWPEDDGEAARAFRLMKGGAK